MAPSPLGTQDATQDKQNAELLNIFFSNAVRNLKISRFSNTNPLAERLSDPTLKAILKYKNQLVLLLLEMQIIIPILISMELVLKKFIKR